MIGSLQSGPCTKYADAEAVDDMLWHPYQKKHDVAQLTNPAQVEIDSFDTCKPQNPQHWGFCGVHVSNLCQNSQRWGRLNFKADATISYIIDLCRMDAAIR